MDFLLKQFRSSLYPRSSRRFMCKSRKSRINGTVMSFRKSKFCPQNRKVKLVLRITENDGVDSRSVGDVKHYMQLEGSTLRNVFNVKYIIKGT